ncbi:MAG: acyl-CoA thioesterase [Desmonostoc vinosum HA7617-LM4]|nr:acyl-CoA thioesterase [Desmonostoc vinosum HA7617-LM4]
MNFETVNLKLQVRPNDLDSLGHVNNAIVLEYLEAGRWSWLERHNLARGKRIIPVVARIEINYSREILPGEVNIITKLMDVEENYHYQVIFHQFVETCQDGIVKVAADARVKVAFIDSVERTLRTLQDFLDENTQQHG